MTLKFEHKLYIVAFLQCMLPIVPLFTLMVVERGYTPLQIGFSYAITSVVQILCEVPSGVLADRFSRKKVLLGTLVLYLLCLVPMFFNYYWCLMLHSAILGVAFACESGTLEAFIYDELHAQSREGEYAKVLGNKDSAVSIAFAVSSLLAFFFVQNGYNLLITVSIIAIGVAFAIMLFVSEVPRVNSVGDRDYFDILREGIGNVLSCKKLFFFVTVLAVFFAVFMSCKQFFSPFALGVGWDAKKIALMTFIICIIQAVASNQARKFSNLAVPYLVAIMTFAGLTILLSAMWYGVLSPASLFVFFGLYYITSVNLRNKQQQYVSSAVRATVFSVSGFFSQVLLVTILISFGFIAKFGYQYGFLFIGGLLTVLSGIYVLYSRVLR